MRTPRDVSGRTLAKPPEREFGYVVTRQRGSHIRITTETGGTHHITLPDHDPLRLGTMTAVLNEVATHLKLSRREVEIRLFEK